MEESPEASPSPSGGGQDKQDPAKGESNTAQGGDADRAADTSSSSVATVSTACSAEPTNDAVVADAAGATAAAPAPSKMASGEMKMKASAPAFVPQDTSEAQAIYDELAEQAKAILSRAAARGEARSQAEAAKEDMLSRLPENYKRMLRGYYQDVLGNWMTYYVGNLKSFSSRSGYGFIECTQSWADYGMDVFIHRNEVQTPWHVGQPVEFAVFLNTRGQPQACDVKWLPLLPQQRTAFAKAAPALGTFSAAAPMPAQAHVQDSSGYSASTGSAAIAVPAPAATFNGGGVAAQAAATTSRASPETNGSNASSADDRSKSARERFIGVLKSYSPAQGYGFFSCDEVWALYSRDTYFDKSQMPKPSWSTGQTIEFSVILNTRNQPQARDINWDPVPLLPKDEKQRSEPDAQQGPRSHQPHTIEKVTKLLRYIKNSELETALVTSISNVGDAAKLVQADAESDIDYVTFVLDRIGDETAAASTIKDFVKMLVVLWLVKSVRKKYPIPRLEKMVRWVDVLSRDIDPSLEQVRNHFQDVAKQISNHIETACSENEDTAKQGIANTLREASQRLKAKGEAAFGNGGAGQKPSE